MKVKESETTEFEKALYTSLEEMKEEFKVVKNALDLEHEKNKEQTARIEKLTTQVERINTDLHLKPHSGRGDSTRKIARDAFNQSTVQANWEGLEEHPVIKNIYAGMIDIRKEEHNDFVKLEQRLDRAQPANEVFKELENTAIIKQLKDDNEERIEEIARIQSEMDKDRHHANQQDLRLRDRMADLETCQNGFEFLLSEQSDKQNSANIFVMGAFAEMGHGKVVDGLHEILKKPKEEKKKDATPS